MTVGFTDTTAIIGITWKTSGNLLRQATSDTSAWAAAVPASGSTTFLTTAPGPFSGWYAAGKTSTGTKSELAVHF